MKKHIFLYLGVAMMLSGCVEDVSPWEKETLAKPTMKDGGTNALAKKFEEHMYYSKEASKGGSGVAGGGCGCN
jgi:PBP1b-binding outer membrane lipoprotein LpoB